MSTNIAMLIFGLVGTIAGICILVWTDPIFRFFKTLSDTMTIYPEKMRNAAMQPANLRLSGFLAIAFGILNFSILAGRLLTAHV